MAVDVSTIISGLYSFLTDDNALNTFYGGDSMTAGRIYYGTAPRETSRPYMVFFVAAGAGTMETMDTPGFYLTIQFSAIADAAGALQCVNGMDALRSVLHRATFTAASHEVMTVTETATARGPFFDVDGWQSFADYAVSGHTA